MLYFQVKVHKSGNLVLVLDRKSGLPERLSTIRSETSRVKLISNTVQVR